MDEVFLVRVLDGVFPMKQYEKTKHVQRAGPTKYIPDLNLIRTYGANFDVSPIP